MAEDDIRFLRSTPVLMSADYERSRDFYTGRLGYRILEEGGDPPKFGIFARGGSVLFVDAWQGARTAVPEAWDAYIHIRDLDRLAASLRCRGVRISKDVHETVYGMREFEVTDPDGNVLCFGEDLEDQALA